jgi:hypothetical protein
MDARHALESAVGNLANSGVQEGLVLTAPRDGHTGRMPMLNVVASEARSVRYHPRSPLGGDVPADVETGTECACHVSKMP